MGNIDIKHQEKYLWKKSMKYISARTVVPQYTYSKLEKYLNTHWWGWSWMLLICSLLCVAFKIIAIALERGFDQDL